MRFKRGADLTDSRDKAGGKPLKPYVTAPRQRSGIPWSGRVDSLATAVVAIALALLWIGGCAQRVRPLWGDGLVISRSDLLYELGVDRMYGSTQNEDLLVAASAEAFGFLGSNPATVSVGGQRVAVSAGPPVEATQGTVQIVNGKLWSPDVGSDPARTAQR